MSKKSKSSNSSNLYDASIRSIFGTKPEKKKMSTKQKTVAGGIHISFTKAKYLEEHIKSCLVCTNLINNGESTKKCPTWRDTRKSVKTARKLVKA